MANFVSVSIFLELAELCVLLVERSNFGWAVQVRSWNMYFPVVRTQNTFIEIVGGLCV